jgi:N-methylhydantoinase A
VETPVYDRQALRPGDAMMGPAIVTEYSSATILPPEDRLTVDALDNLIVEVHG